MTATTPPPPPPFPTEADETAHGKSVTLPRWLVVTSLVVAALVLLGGAFAAGYALRGGDGGDRAPSAVPTSCRAADILGAVKDWSEATNRYYDAPSETEEEDQAYAEMTTQERRLNATLARCS